MKKPTTEREWLELVIKLQTLGDELATAINDPDYYDTLDDRFESFTNFSGEIDEFLYKPSPRGVGHTQKSIEEILAE